MVSEVDGAVGDEQKTSISLGRKTGEGIGALNAKSHTIVLDTVGDGSWNARTPVPSLGIAG